MWRWRGELSNAEFCTEIKFKANQVGIVVDAELRNVNFETDLSAKEREFLPTQKIRQCVLPLFK